MASPEKIDSSGKDFDWVEFERERLDKQGVWTGLQIERGAQDAYGSGQLEHHGVDDGVRGHDGSKPQRPATGSKQLLTRDLPPAHILDAQRERDTTRRPTTKETQTAMPYIEQFKIQAAADAARRLEEAQE